MKKVILIVGPQGSGKSALARKMCEDKPVIEWLDGYLILPETTKGATLLIDGCSSLEAHYRADTFMENAERLDQMIICTQGLFGTGWLPILQLPYVEIKLLTTTVSGVG